jgi:hypothetical protein
MFTLGLALFFLSLISRENLYGFLEVQPEWPQMIGLIS